MTETEQEMREWEEISREWMDTDCAVFRDSIRRRDATDEKWGIFIWGGIFDCITGGMAFPDRASDCE